MSSPLCADTCDPLKRQAHTYTYTTKSFPTLVVVLVVASPVVRNRRLDQSLGNTKSLHKVERLRGKRSNVRANQVGEGGARGNGDDALGDVPGKIIFNTAQSKHRADLGENRTRVDVPSYRVRDCRRTAQHRQHFSHLRQFRLTADLLHD